MRVKIAASAAPSDTAGNPRLNGEFAPDTGNHPIQIANTRIKIGPSANPGNEIPNKLTTLNIRSCHRDRCTADQIPAGKASASAIISAGTVNCSMYGYRVNTRCETESFSRTDLPRSPCSTPFQ